MKLFVWTSQGRGVELICEALWERYQELFVWKSKPPISVRAQWRNWWEYKKVGWLDWSALEERLKDQWDFLCISIQESMLHFSDTLWVHPDRPKQSGAAHHWCRPHAWTACERCAGGPKRLKPLRLLETPSGSRSSLGPLEGSRRPFFQLCQCRGSKKS